MPQRPEGRLRAPPAARGFNGRGRSCSGNSGRSGGGLSLEKSGVSARQRRGIHARTNRRERATALSLERHVRAVASEPHNLDHPQALEASARYIENTLFDFGLKPERQVFAVNGVEVRNIEVNWGLTSQNLDAATLVIGAHYDSADDSPGANDNGTGVAALLEIARTLATAPPKCARPLRLVFFVNEEAPYGKTADMGALHHAEKLKARGERVLGMIALETLGYFSNTPGSQKLPFPFNWIYPTRGNFVAFVGLPGSRAILQRAVKVFRNVCAFPSTGTIAPGAIEGADLSDHWAYHHVGFPALMITDTAPYRNPFYHQRHDTPDTVDYASLARITTGVERMVRELVDRI